VRISLEAAPMALDGMVVTAARRAQRLRDVATTTEVVTRADIERTGASDLASVLLEQTGIQLQGGHPRHRRDAAGDRSERVLILLDGQRWPER
jgi:outer membrane cobalamin receptor